jgi:hypothetical protein
VVAVSHQGGAELPYPLPGYWGATDLQSKIPALAVLDPPGLDLLPDDPPFFFACGAGMCKGGKKFECAEGYTGVQCSECEIGYFQFRGACETKCADLGDPTAVTIFGIFAVMIVWVLMNLNTKYAAVPLSASSRPAST